MTSMRRRERSRNDAKSMIRGLGLETSRAYTRPLYVGCPRCLIGRQHLNMPLLVGGLINPFFYVQARTASPAMVSSISIRQAVFQARFQIQNDYSQFQTYRPDLLSRQAMVQGRRCRRLVQACGPRPRRPQYPGPRTRVLNGQLWVRRLQEPSTEKLFTSDPVIRNSYYAEVERMLKKRLPGVKKVVIFDHTIPYSGYTPRTPTYQISSSITIITGQQGVTPSF
jgi:hypothetical protein